MPRGIENGPETADRRIRAEGALVIAARSVLDVSVPVLISPTRDCFRRQRDLENALEELRLALGEFESVRGES